MLLFLLLVVGPAAANLLSKAIATQTIELNTQQYQFIGIPQSAVNGTEVELALNCADNLDMTFIVQFMIRSSPCDKEFFTAHNGSHRLSDLLVFYFNSEDSIPDYYDYSQMVYFKSSEKTFNCRDSHGHMLFTTENRIPAPLRVANVSRVEVNPTTAADVSATRKKREYYPGINANTIDGGTKTSLSTWHPIVSLPIDAIYFIVVRLKAVQPINVHGNVTVTVTWRAPYGYLSAIDYPLLRFYTIMCVFYGILSMVWLYLCIKYYKDILRIQYWIGAVIILGMVEKAFFYSEYATMNSTGESTEGVIQLAELVSCLKRTMSRVLIIIVSLGYGVVKPRLGTTLNQVAGIGFIYFVFCAIEGLARVSKNQVEAAKQKQFAALPLVIIEMTIFYWIFTALVSTMRTLKLRRNDMKLSVYRHFMNSLCFAVIASVIFMIWSMMYHIFPKCLKDWKEIWVDTAFWHVLFCALLVVIMILWRPSNNNQRYAFTPLLDDSEDENDDDELFNAHTGQLMESVKQRDTRDVRESREAREQREQDSKLEEELRWIENNIPSSLTDHLLIDEDEDQEARELERSKML